MRVYMYTCIYMYRYTYIYMYTCILSAHPIYVYTRVYVTTLPAIYMYIMYTCLPALLTSRIEFLRRSKVANVLVLHPDYSRPHVAIA